MKVRVSFTLDIDPYAWVETYCVKPGEVRGDVRQLARILVEEQFEAFNLLLPVEEP